MNLQLLAPSSRAMILGALLGGLLSACVAPPQKLCLSGCASSASIHANREAVACIGRIADNPAYRSVARHLPIDGSDPKPSQMLDDSRPTAEEARLLTAIRSDMADCRKRTLESFARLTPALVPLAEEAYRESDRIWDALIRREMSWAEANQQRFAVKYELTRRAERLQLETIEGLESTGGAGQPLPLSGPHQRP